MFVLCAVGRSPSWAAIIIFIMAPCQRAANDRAYVEAVEGAFGMDVDYAQLQNIFTARSRRMERDILPTRCIGM